MRLTALKTHIDQRLSDKKMTWEALNRKLGFNKSSVWRKLGCPPWEYHSRDSRFFSRMAKTIEDNMEKLLWLGGYNPFVKHRLSGRELYLLYELLTRVVYMLKDGTLTADGLANSVAVTELAELAKKRR